MIIIDVTKLQVIITKLQKINANVGATNKQTKHNKEKETARPDCHPAMTSPKT